MRKVTLLAPGEPARELAVPGDPVTIPQDFVLRAIGGQAIAACGAGASGTAALYYDPSANEKVPINDGAMTLRAPGEAGTLRGPVLLIETQAPPASAEAAAAKAARRKNS